MSTSYDLLLQPPPGAAFLAAGPVTDLDALAPRPAGQAHWHLVALGQDVTARLVHDGGQPVAVELSVPLSDRPHALEAAVSWAVATADRHGLWVVDPAAGRRVRQVDPTLLDGFMRAARYAGEYAGVSAAVGASTLARPVPGSTVGGRVLLAVAVFLLALYATFSYLVRAPG